VTLTGERSGTKTYTTRNPDNKLLSSIRSLQAAADTLSASPPASGAAIDESDSTTANHQDVGIATQLKMLADLDTSGALTDEEFAAAKDRLLS
jgi:hypothetical protein